MPLIRFFAILVISACLPLASLAAEPTGEKPSSKESAPATEKPAAEKPAADKDAKKWRPLFDGKTLKGWKVSEFYGVGEVEIVDGAIIMKPGVDMTGITATQKMPKVNYEIQLEAKRVEGTDFFCGITFPIKEDFCSLIIGGWGGGVVGLSSLNGMDASENETTTFRDFKNGQWYPIKLRVTANRVTAWIGDEEEINVDIAESTISTRIEVEWSKPFGIATWNTTGAIRNLKIRDLSDQEVKRIEAEKINR